MLRIHSLLGLHEHFIVRKFQNIPKVKVTEAAVYVLEINGWDLDRAMRWYHDHRNDYDMPQDLKAYLYNDYKEETPGIQFITFSLFVNFKSISVFSNFVINNLV